MHFKMPVFAKGPTLAPAALGGLLMIAAAMAFAIMTALIRHVGQELPPIQIAFLRNLFGALFLAPILLRSGRGIFHTNRLSMHGMRSLIGICGMFSWFTAVTLIPLGQAVALNFTAPLFTTVIAALVLGEIVRVRRWSATIVGFVGTLIVLRPGVVPISTGAGLAMISAVTLALNLILLRVMGRTERPVTIVAFMALIQVPLSAIPAAFLWITPSWQAVALTAVIGSLGTLGHLALSRALTLADASALAPLDFIRMPFIILIGYLAFAELPDKWTIIGAIIIVGSAAYIGHREAKLARRVAAAPRSAS